MKIFKIIAHHYSLIICFLAILISGQHLGGFYIFYLLLALPYGGIHSILAILGIIVLLTSYRLFGCNEKNLGQVLNFVGVSLLFGSLYYFFWNDKQHYNWGTFEQVIPMLTIIITGFVALCFLLRNIFGIWMSKKIVSV